MQKAPDPGEIALGERRVQPQLLAQRREGFWVGAHAHHVAGGIAGRDLQQGEHYQAGDDQGSRQRSQPFRQIGRLRARHGPQQREPHRRGERQPQPSRGWGWGGARAHLAGGALDEGRVQGQGADRRRRPDVLDLGAPDPDRRVFEQEQVDRVACQGALHLAEDGVALGRIQGVVELGQQLFVARVRIAEIVAVPGVDVVVHRFDMGDDAHVEVVPPEHLGQPLGPFDILYADLHPGFGQFGGDHLAGSARIGRGRQLQAEREPVRIAGLSQQRLRPRWIVRIDPGQIHIAWVLRRIVAPDRLGVAEHGRRDDRPPVDGVGQGLAHPHIIQRRAAVVQRHQGLGLGGADAHHEARIGFQGGQRLGRRKAVEAVDVAGL